MDEENFTTINMSYRIITDGNKYRIQRGFWIFWRDVINQTFDRDGLLEEPAEYSTLNEARGFIAAIGQKRWKVVSVKPLPAAPAKEAHHE